MAYQKITWFKIKCDGPCNATSVRVSVIPEDWRRMKVHRVSPKSGTSYIEREVLLCPKCIDFALDLLLINGFNFPLSENVNNKGEQQ